ncbi:SRPBCC family protein [Natronorubrum sulfidifaciens]|uniref:Polyketide cyclase/dehydrase n=1 Tax=Natronorubrum sulfidifaciens JCM 14089 TaxID=1230460 RepID=L9W259_9EURY|nr:SRPBCC family protein [Natronorubrum sulfidifaciens]ELY43432.1 polyketide cyclase/dehydrase [Natronorubrum sulfidifaciens JCM 14089]
MTRLQTAHTPDGRRLEASQVCSVPADDAWDLLVDTTQWPEWMALVNGVEATDRRIRADTTGHVRVSGVWIPFRVTDYSRSDRRWSWRVTGVPIATHRVEALDETRCRISFELPFFAVGSAPISLRALESLESMLEGD